MLKTALVTGGARRIGKAIVEDLAAHDFAVAVHYGTSADAAEALVASITARGGRAVGVQTDLAHPHDVANIVEKAAAALGPLTLLVNSASIFEKDAVDSLDMDIWSSQFAINLTSPVFLAEAFVKQLPEGIEGNIINILDQRVLQPSPAYFSYQLTKSALATATLTMAQALAPRVRVNGIAPGPVLPSPHQSEDVFAAQVRSIPLGRAPDLADFGRTVRYIVETRSMTGQIIALDGGQHLAPRPQSPTS